MYNTQYQVSTNNKGIINHSESESEYAQMLVSAFDGSGIVFWAGILAEAIIGRDDFDFFAMPSFDRVKVRFAPLRVSVFFSAICFTLDEATT